MKLVYKYVISEDHSDMEDHKTILLPKGADILRVGMQINSMVLWAVVDTEIVETEKRSFRIAGTGHPLGDMEELYFIDSIFDGPYVWHVFEVK